MELYNNFVFQWLLGNTLFKDAIKLIVIHSIFYNVESVSIGYITSLSSASSFANKKSHIQILQWRVNKCSLTYSDEGAALRPL